jgi:hypothetical protein
MKHNTLMVTAAGLVLAACGSSGGDTPPPVVSPPVSINIDANNAPLVAGVSYGAAQGSGEFGDMEGSLGPLGAGPGGVSKLDRAFGAAAKTSPGNTGSSIPIPAERTMCTVDGFVTFSGEIADPITPTLTKDDFFEFFFEMCDEGTGEVTDGRLRSDVTSFSGDLFTSLYALGMRFTFTTLQVTEGTEVYTSHGDATVFLDALNLPFAATSISGNSMRVDSNTGSETLTNFSHDVTFDGNFIPAPYTMLASGTLDSTELTGVIDYSMDPLTKFEGFEGEFPNTGELLVEGTNSALRLVAEDNVNVTIYVDTNGDGIFDDEVIATTWDALTN